MSNITKTEPLQRAERIEGSNEPVLPRVGQWYWMKTSEHVWFGEKPSEFSDEEKQERTAKAYTEASRTFAGAIRNLELKDAEDGKRLHFEGLVYVAELGSNYVAVENVRAGNSRRSWRVHLDELESELTLEPNAAELIAQYAGKARAAVAQYLAEVNEVTNRLGLGTAQQSLEAGTAGLVVASSNKPAEVYKSALVHAKEKTLPDLFKRIEEANELVGVWLAADVRPLKALARQLEPVLERVDARIFNVELYAGLTETSVCVRKGKPAEANEPLHLHQRRHYMDEESVFGYEAGGMDCRNLDDFDAWLARPHNLERVLPFPRSVVAFRIRRFDKDYEWKGGSWRDFVRFSLTLTGQKAADKVTYLYMRNGAQLHRLEVDEFSFEEQLFPDMEHQHLTGKLYVREKKWRNDGFEFITKDDYEVRQAKAALARAEYPKALARFEAVEKTWREKHRRVLSLDEHYTPKSLAPDASWKRWDVKLTNYARRALLMRCQGLTEEAAIKVEEAARNDDKPRLVKVRTGKDWTMVDLDEVELHASSRFGPARWAVRHRFGGWPEAGAKEAALEAVLPAAGLYAEWEPLAAACRAEVPACPMDPDAHNHRHSDSRPAHADWAPLDDSYIQLDDAMTDLQKKRDGHNRLVLILQGLLDRSKVFSPHPPWKLWEGDTSKALVLHYDTSRALAPSEEAPKFRALQAEANKGLKVGALIAGAQGAFYAAEYKKREKDVERRGRGAQWNRVENPGPGLIARVTAISRAKRTVTVKWTARRSYWNGRPDATQQKTLRIPFDEVFCVDGYEPGTMRKFFDDPRTRAEYLKWAPFLMAAEDFAAGKLSEGQVERGDNEVKVGR